MNKKITPAIIMATFNGRSYEIFKSEAYEVFINGDFVIEFTNVEAAYNYILRLIPGLNLVIYGNA